MSLGCVGIIIILRWYGAEIFLSGAAITDKGSPVQTEAGFLLKPRAHQVTFMAGPAQGITDPDLLTGICLFAAEPVDTKVIRIIEAPLVPGVQSPMPLDLLIDGGRIFTQELGYVFERLPLI